MACFLGAMAPVIWRPVKKKKKITSWEGSWVLEVEVRSGNKLRSWEGLGPERDSVLGEHSGSQGWGGNLVLGQ